ncbi:MAG: MaoC family dehydratase [Spirosomataceae bacterium]|jgi:acyl dehydratase
MAEKIPVGSEYRMKFSFTQDDVIAFANLTGDHNPIHLDAEYAAQTPFKKPIIHGHLSSSVFTKFLGMNKPGGPGSVYMKQVTEYLRPMFVDTEYEVVFRVEAVNEARSIADISTEVFNVETKKVTIRGTGTLMNKENF